MALNAPSSSGVLYNASREVPRKPPESSRIGRWLIGGAFILMAGTTAYGVFGKGNYESLIVAAALAVWGTRAIIGPAPLNRVRWFDVLVYAAYIPLAPFYLNLGAEAIWGEQWEQVSPTLRVSLMSIATFISTVLVVAAWMLHVHEVRRFRSSYLRDAIYAALDTPAWRHLSYTERAERGDDLKSRWGKVALPLERCELLIRAGIEPEAAKKTEAKALTDENLQAMAWMLSSQQAATDRC